MKASKGGVHSKNLLSEKRGRVWSSGKREGPKVIAVPSSRVTVVAHRGKGEREARTEGPFRREPGM